MGTPPVAVVHEASIGLLISIASPGRTSLNIAPPPVARSPARQSACHQPSAPAATKWFDLRMTAVAPADWPASPLSPLSPFGPLAPAAPAAPVSPVSPFGPCAPGSPAGPCGPGSPFGPA